MVSRSSPGGSKYGNIETKPLPPTPRKPSSLYSVATDDESPKATAPTLCENGLSHTKPQFKTPKYNEESTLSRPRLAREQHLYTVSDLKIREQEPNQADSVKDIHSLQDSFQNSEYGHPAESWIDEPASRERRQRPRDANQHASNYESILHTRSSNISGVGLEAQLYLDHPPSPMSPRITDVVDPSLMPSPLRISAMNSASHFSSSSSDNESIRYHANNSLQSHAWNAFTFDRDSDKESEMAHARSRPLMTLPPTEPREVVNAPTARRGSRVSSIINQRRASLQQSLSNMYHTLSSISFTPAKSKPSIDGTTTHKTRVPRALRSPAIPLTPYQQLGRKAWETPSNSSLLQVTRSSWSSLPRTSYPPRSTSVVTSDKNQNSLRHSTPVVAKDPKPISMVGKITSALQSGTAQVESAIRLNRPNVKRTKSEIRREKLKKKILVVRGIHQGSEEQYTSWL